MPNPAPPFANNQIVTADNGNTTLGANADFITVDVTNYDFVGFDVFGTWTATISIESSVDGTNYSGHQGSLNTGASAGSSRTTTGQFFVNVVGCSFIRLRVSAYTSGTATVAWRCDRNTFGPTPTTAFSISGSVTPGTGAANLGKAEDATHTTGDVGVLMLGVRNDAAATPTNADTDYSQLSVTGSGALFTVETLANLQAALGITLFRQIAAGTTNATSIKGASGSVGSITVNNTSAAIKYLKFYNKATAPTVGTDIPVLVFAVPPTSTVVFAPTVAIPFTAGIASATTALGTDADATAVTASDLSFTIIYR
jgi:hypothetical protein